MSNLNNRITKLEGQHAPPEEKRIVVIYSDAGRVTEPPEYAGMTLDELKAKLNDENVTLLNVVFIPDNGREDAQA